ncbi:MAG TPA: enoyl-CoA hydratase-related protein [Hyphomicrobiales bacterium]|nr:enoyl-CoA hydratase-related protein [Hyphomicrobiales bacterium]
MNYPAELDGMRWEKSGKAGTIIFDRPPMNTISFKQRSQIAKLIEAMDQDPEIRVIVIRGANGVYSSGGDIAGFLVPGRDQMHDLAWNVAAPERAKKPVIAAMEKWAMGVAFELALACDFRLATENTQLALPEITLGTIPGSGGTHRIAHLVGLTRAKAMIMRGKRLPAKEAYDWGILSEVVPDQQLDEAIARWVDELAALPQIPLTALKRVLNGAYEMPLNIGLQFEGQTFEKIRFNPEFRHGVESFLAKKKPDFSHF